MKNINRNFDIFILCGGEGRRLRKITGMVPKTMVPIGERPFLDILLGHLRRAGFKRVVLGIGYQADFIRQYYRNRNFPGMKIVFSRERRPLGTGGALKNAQRFIKTGIFFVLNGDSFSEFNPNELVKFFEQKKARFLIVLKESKDARGYGAVTTDKRSRITSFGARNPALRSKLINSGVYLFSQSSFSEMPKDKAFSLEYDFFPKMAGKGLYGYKNPGFFIDIGTPQRYQKAKKYFLEHLNDG